MSLADALPDHEGRLGVAEAAAGHALGVALHAQAALPGARQGVGCRSTTVNWLMTFWAWAPEDASKATMNRMMARTWTWIPPLMVASVSQEPGRDSRTRRISEWTPVPSVLRPRGPLRARQRSTPLVRSTHRQRSAWRQLCSVKWMPVAQRVARGFRRRARKALV